MGMEAALGNPPDARVADVESHDLRALLSPLAHLEISLLKPQNHCLRRTSLFSLIVGVKCLAISKHSVH